MTDDIHLRIVHTEASCGWGGQELRILAEATGLRARGHEVSLLCPPQARIYEEARARGIPVTALPIGRKNLRGLLALRRWLKSHDVDVVNTHSSVDSWLVALVSRLFRRSPPMVRTRHIAARILNNTPTRWLYQRATRMIVTTGEQLRRQLVEDNRFDPSRVVSVPTGIDGAYFTPGDKRAARAQLGLPPDVPLIGIVATLRSWKGHRYLVDAFTTLTGPHCRLVIVGDGPQRGALEHQIADLGLRERVLLAGNQQDVRPWLRALDVFVLPSYANEGVPQAVVQAMLCGLPVVSTPIGSIPEAVTHEETGLVVPPRQVAPLAAAIERLLADPALGARLGAQARARALARFGLAHMLDEMEAVFRAASARATGAGLRFIYLHRLHLTTGSGQTIQVLRDYHAMAARGARVDLFYRAPRPLGATELAQLLADHHLAPLPHFHLHWLSEAPFGRWRLKFAARRLLRADVTGAPAVVVTRTLEHARHALSLRRSRPPRTAFVVLELHEIALPHLVYREAGRERKARFSEFIERWIFRSVDGIVCTVGSQAKLLDELFPRHAPYSVLPNGVDLEAFAGATPRPRAGATFHLRYAGQFSAWKNPEIMLEALCYLPVQVQLDLAGGRAGEEEETRTWVDETARRYGVRARVNYVGFVPPKDVPAFLRAADVLLLPLGDNVQSRYFTSPMKLFEYAASGVPMVVTRQPTTLSLLGDREQALLVPPDSARELAGAVQELLASPALAESVATQAQTWVRQYSYGARAARYETFLRGLLRIAPAAATPAPAAARVRAK